MGDIAVEEAREVDIPREDQATGLIAIVDRLLERPDLPIDKIEKFIDLQVQAEGRAAKRAFFEAMSDMQPHLPVIEHTKKISYEDKKGNTVVKGSYTPWEDIDEQIRPHYTEHGFSLSFDIHYEPNQPITVTCIVMHRDGHSTRTSLPLPSDTSGSKNTVQGIGSSITYGKRYTACAALNVTTRGQDGETDDDDGAKAGQPMNARQAKEHTLWETLVSELKADVSTVQEADDWLERTKQHRQEYRQMPLFWRRLFYNEVFLPHRENLPGTV